MIGVKIVAGCLIVGYWFGILGSLSSAPEGNFWRAATYILGWPRPLWLYLHGEWLQMKPPPLRRELHSGQELGLYK